MTLSVCSASASCVTNHYEQLSLVGLGEGDIIAGPGTPKAVGVGSSQPIKEGTMGEVYGDLKRSENVGEFHTSVLRDMRGDT